jgi:methylated-DNA-[protein]-cysteine S-methyltransferase
LVEELGDGCVGNATDWVDVCRRQIEEYFLGKRTGFRVEVDLRGTPFQKNVWRTIKKIPFGKVRTYGEVARMAGREGAFRAVGQAAGANPLPLLIPCHRVVAAGGKLGGFGSGLGRKRWLLEFEMNQR